MVFLAIEPDKITELADTIKMIASFWISYQLTQSSIASISKSELYRGLLRILMIFHAYATPDSKSTFERLEQHYFMLANKLS